MVAHRILGRVKRLRFGMRWVLKLEMLLALILLLLMGVIAGLLFILHFGPTPFSLGIFSGTSFALILYIFWRFIFRNRRKRLSTLAMSAWVEQAIPGLSDRLITAVEFTQGVRLHSGEAVIALYDSDFITAFFEDTERLLRRLFLMRVFFRRRLIALLIALLAVLAVYQNIHHFTTYTSSDLNKIYLNSHRAIFRGMGAPLVVEPGSTKIVRGGDLKVSAYSLRVGGKPKMEIFFCASEQPWESASMVGEAGGSFSFHFQQLSQPLKYFVSDGKAKSEEYEIQLVDGPQLANIRVKLVMPSYTGLGIMIGDDGEGDIKAVGGTRAEVVVSFREEIEKATLLIGQGEAGDESETTNRLNMVENSGNWRTEFRIDSSGWYRIVAVDEEGFSSGKELTYTIEVKEEEKPTIEIISPSTDIDFLATDAFPELKEGKIPQVPLLYKCDDDFGIARVELHFKQPEGVTGTRILEDFDYGQQHVEREYRWNIEPFWGGEMVVYFLRVYDHFALREIREMGQTEHYQDSRKLRFYWGQTQILSENETTEIMDSKKQEEGQKEKSDGREDSDSTQKGPGGRLH